MELENNLMPFIQDLKNEHLSIQAAVDRNLSKLLSLKNAGYSFINIKRILDSKGISISDYYFREILRRSRKKHSNDLEQSANTTFYAHKESNLPKVDNSNQSTRKNNFFKFSETDWRIVGVDSNNLKKDLEDANYTPNDVKNWNCSNSIQIRNKLDNLVNFGKN